MQITSVVPCLILTAAFVGLGAVIAAIWPFYRGLTAPGSGGKVESLDGLRGYLALGVFFHHGFASYNQRATGLWDVEGSPFYAMLGSVAVKMFFIITGFLFWTKAIRGSASLPPRKLFQGRILRVGPMYLFISALVYGTILAENGFRLTGTPFRIALGLVSPFTLGLFQWRPIDGVSPLTLNAGVTWTLQYEWAFYLALPLLAWMATPRRFAVLVLIVVALLPWARRYDSYALSLNFLIGMAVAHSLQSFGPIRPLTGRVASVACLALMASMPIAATYGVRIPSVAVMAVVFPCLAHGNTLFGGLTNRGAKVLGTASYSLYLLHGFVLYLGWKVLDRIMGPGVPSPTIYWSFMVACGAVSVLASALTYRYVEHPFIALGHRLGRTPKVIIPEAQPQPAAGLVPDLAQS